MDDAEPECVQPWCKDVTSESCMCLPGIDQRSMVVTGAPRPASERGVTSDLPQLGCVRQAQKVFGFAGRGVVSRSAPRRPLSWASVAWQSGVSEPLVLFPFTHPLGKQRDCVAAAEALPLSLVPG